MSEHARLAYLQEKTSYLEEKMRKAKRNQRVEFLISVIGMEFVLLFLNWTGILPSAKPLDVWVLVLGIFFVVVGVAGYYYHIHQYNVLMVEMFDRSIDRQIQLQPQTWTSTAG